MCTDLVIYAACPGCGNPIYTQVIYQRACEEAMDVGRVIGDFITTYGNCAGGLCRETRKRLSDEPCGICRWKAWMRTREELRGVDFWAYHNRRAPGGAKLQTPTS